MKSRRFPIFILRDRDISSRGMDNGEVDVVIAPLIVLKSLDCYGCHCSMLSRSNLVTIIATKHA